MPIKDIGMKTCELIEDFLNEAKTVIISGTVGVYEEPLFNYGTTRVLKAIEELSRYDFYVANFLIINNVLTANVIAEYGSDNLKELVLPGVAKRRNMLRNCIDRATLR